MKSYRLAVLLTILVTANAGAETVRLTLAETVERARASSPRLGQLAALQTAAARSSRTSPTTTGRGPG